MRISTWASGCVSLTFRRRDASGGGTEPAKGFPAQARVPSPLRRGQQWPLREGGRSGLQVRDPGLGQQGQHVYLPRTPMSCDLVAPSGPEQMFLRPHFLPL